MRSVRRQLRCGFTLIELIIVLVVISVMLALAAPSLRGWGRGAELDDAARSFLAATSYARTQALATATPHRVEIDPDGTAFGVTRQDGQAFAVDPKFETVQLPTNCTVAIIAGGNGTALEFFPTGRTTPATVRVSSRVAGDVQLACDFPSDTFHRVNTGGTR